MNSLILILAGTLVLQAPGTSKSEKPAQGAADPSKKATTKKTETTLTPEETLRAFFVAMVSQDEKALRELSLPVDGFELLLGGQPVPPDQLEAVRTMISQQPIRTLKPGDLITLPGRSPMTIRPADVTDDRAILLPEGSPVPNRLKKVDGRWRVDPTPIIAGRKAADAARKKAEKKGK